MLIFVTSMQRLRKNIILVLLFFVLLVSLGSKGYACVSDQTSVRIESSEQLKFISDFISILGEGAFQGQKSLISQPANHFYSIDPFYITGISLYNNRYFWQHVDGSFLQLALPYISEPALFISLSTWLI